MQNMWSNSGIPAGDKKPDSVAVAIDKDKSSQYALKWAVDHVLSRGQTVTLIHVKQKQSHIPTPNGSTVSISDVGEDAARSLRQQSDNIAREIFLPFRCFCTRKDIKCNEVILEDVDIPRAVLEYVTTNAVEVMVAGASSRNGFVSRRFKGSDVATSLTKLCPDYCTVYVISKGKMTYVRNATRPPPRPISRSPLPTSSAMSKVVADIYSSPARGGSPCRRNGNGGSPYKRNGSGDDSDSFRSPFTRGRAANGRSYGELSMSDSDISFVSSGRPSPERISIDRTPYDVMDFTHGPRLSNGSDGDRVSVGSSYSDRRSIDLNSATDYSSSNISAFSPSPMNLDNVESEMRRLRMELRQTMEMYNAACKEALTAKQTANELEQVKEEEDLKVEEARMSEETAMALAEKEKAKCRAAMEAAEAAQKIADLEAQKRMHAEMQAVKESAERKRGLTSLTAYSDARYRRYSIEEIEIATDYFADKRKIGEGGYGPVYRCILDHTPAAIKVLRPDAAQGQSQFQQEVEILSCIRHPNMVLLLGACPEYGCLVYEYMYNGSLEDRLFCRGNTQPLPWQLRFRIAAEIGTGLLFLHQTKPEPLVHRDLKPANILIDRNFVSKISDVGLARLVPPSMADNVTQYRMTQTAGTFCYIDPEYQQTGMLGTKSDIYSLGILFLQLLTAKPAMGLTHHVQRSIERGTFGEMLDPSISDWPFEEALEFAILSLKCAELRRKDRPDLGKDILPELNRWRDFADDHMPNFMMGNFPTPMPKPIPSPASTSQDVISENQSMQSGSSATSTRSRSSSSSLPSEFSPTMG